MEKNDSSSVQSWDLKSPDPQFLSDLDQKGNSTNFIKSLQGKNRSLLCWEEKNTIHTPLALWCCLGWVEKKEADFCQGETATCGGRCEWKWQRGFLSMFEEQLLTFTAKSSNMLSATSGLWAWQSRGFLVIMEIFVDVCGGKAQGGFYQAYHQDPPSIPSPSSPPSAGFHSLWSGVKSRYHHKETLF